MFCPHLYKIYKIKGCTISEYEPYTIINCLLTSQSTEYTIFG